MYELLDKIVQFKYEKLQHVLTLCGIPSVIWWLTIGILFFIYWFGVRPYSVFKVNGIPHPSTKPFLGNIIEFMNQGLVDFHGKNLKKYGHVFGYFIGRRPVVVTTDPTIMEKVLVKDFQHFHSRPQVLLGRKPMDKSLIFCDYDIWKRIRPIVSPTFSSGKLKQMLQYVDKSVDTFVQILSESSRNDEVVDVFGTFGRLTMEVIMSVAFGMENEFQLKGNTVLTKEAWRWFNIHPIVFLVDVFPIPLFIRKWIRERAMPDPAFLVSLLRPVVEERRNKPSQRMDFLQLLLSENKKDGKSKLEDDEIFATAITFLLAGYETSSNALAYTLYLLALNQDVQDKLYEEIKENFHEDKPLYEEIQKLAYLDCVLNESLRVYPPAYVTARLIEKAYKIGNFRFPAGVVIQFPIYNIHHDEKIWENPGKFDPSRFSPENKPNISPYHFMPFGHGPRNCVGARFATMEAKLAIIKVVKKFKIQTSPETEIPLKLRFGITMSPQNGIKLSIKNRS